MQILRPEFDLASFCRSLETSHSRLLMLDYDGTLAPFQIRRDAAVPYPGVPEALQALLLDGTTRVVVVTGRTTQALLPLLNLQPQPEIWGSHGWQRHWPDGRDEEADPGERARSALAEALALVREAWPSQWEEKTAGVTFHLRGLEAAPQREFEERVKPRWRALAEENGLVLHPFEQGWELRVPSRSKGTAVEVLLAEEGAGAAAAFLGDDLTDEDAFRALQGRGLGVLVRTEQRPTAAAAWLKPPEELLSFLATWRTVCQQGRPKSPPKNGW